MSSISAAHPGPVGAWLTRNGGWLIPAAAYLLAWSLWAPLLGRDLGNVSGLPADFLVLALVGNVMPGLAVLLWRIFGGRVPAAGRADLRTPRGLPLWLVVIFALVPAMTAAG